MSVKRWAGRVVTTSRAYWAPRLPLPCRRCGRPVTLTQRWQVGHIIDRADPGSTDALSNQWPEHGRCNEQAGGRRGAAITNAKRQEITQSSARSRGIRGI